MEIQQDYFFEKFKEYKYPQIYNKRNELCNSIGFKFLLKPKVWKCPEGQFMRNISGHNTIVNCMALNTDNVLVSGGDNG